MSQPNQYDADGWRYGVRCGGDGSIMHCWSGPTQRARAEEQIAAICAKRVALYGSDLTDQPHNALTLVRRSATTSWEPAP